MTETVEPTIINKDNVWDYFEIIRTPLITGISEITKNSHDG